MQDSHEAVAEYVINAMAQVLDKCCEQLGGCHECCRIRYCQSWWDLLILKYDSSNFHRDGHKPLADVALAKAYMQWCETVKKVATWQGTYTGSGVQLELELSDRGIPTAILSSPSLERRRQTGTGFASSTPALR